MAGLPANCYTLLYFFSIEAQKRVVVVVVVVVVVLVVVVVVVYLHEKPVQQKV